MRVLGNVRRVGVTSIIRAEIDGDLTVGVHVGIDGHPGRIDDLVVTGNIGSHIQAHDGYIHRIIVGGDIGTSTTPALIKAERTAGFPFFERIEADNIYADVVCNQTSGSIQSIRTTGDFVGTIDVSETTNFGPGVDAIDIGGDFDGEFRVEFNLAVPFRIGGSLLTGSLLRIGNGINPPPEDPTQPTVSIGDADGLKGQIIAVARNNTQQWAHVVRVGAGASSPIDLDGAATSGPDAAPHYTRLSANLGQGAVGKAPFNFHQFTGPAPASRADLDCNPWHTETLRVGPCETVTDLEQVIIDHYGPVFADDAGGNYRIEFHPDFFPNSRSDASALFEVDTAQTDTADGGDNRKVVIVPAAGNATKFNASGWFRFRPIAGKVKCANVAGNPDVAYDSSIVSGDLGDTTSGPQYDWYQFRVRLTLCRDNQILFENDRVNPSDIAAWIGEPFEVNMDGRVCQQDLADLLAAYDAQ